MGLNDSVSIELNPTDSRIILPDVWIRPELDPDSQSPEVDVNSMQGFPNTTVNTNFIENETINQANTSQYNLCGVPRICNSNAQSLCLNTRLGDCQACDVGASGCFIFLVLCLGLAILIGNAFILFATAQMRKKKTATIIDWYKASLAVADLLTGNCC